MEKQEGDVLGSLAVLSGMSVFPHTHTSFLPSFCVYARVIGWVLTPCCVIPVLSLAQLWLWGTVPGGPSVFSGVPVAFPVSPRQPGLSPCLLLVKSWRVPCWLPSPRLLMAC